MVERQLPKLHTGVRFPSPALPSYSPANESFTVPARRGDLTFAFQLDGCTQEHAAGIKAALTEPNLLWNSDYHQNKQSGSKAK